MAVFSVPQSDRMDTLKESFLIHAAWNQFRYLYVVTQLTNKTEVLHLDHYWWLTILTRLLYENIYHKLKHVYIVEL